MKSIFVEMKRFIKFMILTRAGFQPDFILFLKDKEQGKYYQVFIEPKGDYLKKEMDGKMNFKELQKDMVKEMY